MGYVGFLEKSIANKTVLAELDVGKYQDKWYNYQAGIWAYHWRKNPEAVKNIGDGNIGDGTIGAGEYYNYLSIGSVFIDGEEYTKKTTLSDCINNEKSWYFDDTDYYLYVHYIDNDEPQIHTTVVGLTMGLSNKAVYYNHLYYEPRLISAPSIEKTKDPLYFGLIRFDGGSLTFDNHDGYFDTIANQILFGQPIRIYFGGSELSYSEYQKIYTGYIENVNINYETAQFDIVDNKKKFSLRLPTKQFNKTDYPNLDDDDVGKAIPIAYGEVYKAPVICINKAESGTPNWTFKICDTSDHSSGIQSIDHVYVDDIEKTPVSTDLSNGTFTLAYADWDKQKEVTCSFKGLKNTNGLIQNPLDVISDILEVYLEIPYNSTNYNTTEWEEAKSHDLANNIGLFLNEEIEITEIIEKICGSIMGSFIVQSDGKYTFRILDLDREAERTIYIEEMIQAPQVSFNGNEFLTSCKVGYKRDYSKDSYRWFVKNDNEDYIYSKYKKYNSKDFETLLTNETDAQELAEAIMNYYSEVKPVYSIMTSTEVMQEDIEKTINLEINRVGYKWFDYVKAEIVGITKDLIAGTINIVARHISKLVDFYYRVSPFAININEFAININEYAISYGRGKYGVREN